MRKNLVLGILRETFSSSEHRAPLTPGDVKWLIKKGVKVEVKSSKERVFNDLQYKKAGAKVLDRFKQASFLLGIKPPQVCDVDKDKVYMCFSHTIKGQPKNIPLLKEFIKKKVTLIDYEKITDLHSRRLVHFGRFAGICGLIDSLHYLGEKLKYQGIKNPFGIIRPAYEYNSLRQAVQAMKQVNSKIAQQGFDKKISPFIIGITGHGNASQGVQEILRPLNPIEIHPKDMLRFVRHQKYIRHRLYKIVFLREEKLRSKKVSGFYFEEYLQHPERFESNMDIYLPYLNMFVHTSYWDSRYPRIVTKEMIHRLWGKKNFRLQFIADISCDINGSIELTYKTTNQNNPLFTYDPKRQSFSDGYKLDGITILASDNLPSELPRDSSQHFSSLVRDYVYQIAAHGVRDITNHTAIPKEIRQAVITQSGRLTPRFNYLKKYLP
ncbi:MAG: hypothetical protein PVI33_05300 [Candidatus Omnitrophota bacterium]|jgi:alpha-aminoadipic semialdehyde synthase